METIEQIAEEYTQKLSKYFWQSIQTNDAGQPYLFVEDRDIKKFVFDAIAEYGDQEAILLAPRLKAAEELAQRVPILLTKHEFTEEEEDYLLKLSQKVLEEEDDNETD